jgi:hypothetical protein
MYLQPVITICGSLKFWDDGLIQANAMLVTKNIISIPSGFSMKYPEKFPVVADYVLNNPEKMKKIFDELHFQKILMSNGIWITNIDDYIGDSTKREIMFAHKLGKAIFTFERCQFCEENNIYYNIVPLDVNFDFPDWLYSSLHKNETSSIDLGALYLDSEILLYKEFCENVDGK